MGCETAIMWLGGPPEFVGLSITEGHTIDQGGDRHATFSNSESKE